MTSVTFKQFSGSTPRVAPHLLGASTAAEALDCKLWHGTLQSWREPLLVHSTPEGTVTSLLYDCCWLDFATCVDFAYGPVTCRQLFTTGYEDWPAIHEFGEDCAPSVHRLGLPCPTGAPSVFASGTAAEKDTEGRSYAYQYRNADADRSALSRASQAVLVRDGQTVVVSGWDVPDTSWGVVDVLIYRSVSGHQSGREPGNILDTTWMLVGSAPVGAASFTDTKFNDELLNALQEDVASPPPADLRGIVHIASMNSLAGFVGNKLYFSENNSYHHWPYTFTLDDNICAIVESNGMIYVATDGRPYVITGAVDCKTAGCREVVRLPGHYPMTGCGNRRMAATPNGAVYPSHEGLISLSGTAQPTVLTHPLYAPDDWHQMPPESVIPAVHNGKLFVFGRRKSFVLTLPGGPEQGWQMDTHSELSDTDVLDAFTSRTGDFYLLKADGVYQWDRGARYRPHRWVSPVAVTPTPVNFGAAHLVQANGAENVTIRLDGRQVFNRSVLSTREFTLPNWALGTRWQVVLEGTAVVSLFSIASSMKELGA